MRLKTTAFLLACIAALPTAHAGTVNVSFVEPERFVDAGENPLERERNLKRLADHLRELGRQQLPAEQTLTIEVTEVDLAGTMRDIGPRRVRTIRGGADWPRIDMRWTLQANDRTLRSGDERLSELNYLQRGGAPINRGPHPFEIRLLDEWFSARFPSTAQ